MWCSEVASQWRCCGRAFRRAQHGASVAQLCSHGAATGCRWHENINLVSSPRRRPLPGGMGGVSQEEAYQLRHARAMASAHGGWRTAMAYLKWCPKR